MRVRWRSGPVGASWIAIDAALAKIIEESGAGIDIDVVPGGGRENLDSLRDGDCDLATSIGFLASAAYRGDFPYSRDPFVGLRTLALGWNQIPFHLIRASDAPDRQLAPALRSSRARIGVPPESTSDELTFRHLLRHMGSSYAALAAAGATIVHADYHELAELFSTNAIDWIFGATAAPADVVEHISRARAATLLPLDRDVIDALIAMGYSGTVLPYDTYPALQRDDIETVAMTSTIVATDRLPDEIAAQIVGRLVDNIDRVREVHPSLRHVAQTPAFPANGVPRHRGLD